MSKEKQLIVLALLLVVMAFLLVWRINNMEASIFNIGNWRDRGGQEEQTPEEPDQETNQDQGAVLEKIQEGISTLNSGREFELYVPFRYRAKRTHPLMVVLHGGGGTGTQAKVMSRMYEVARKNNFLAAFPNGSDVLDIISGQQGTWNAGDCCTESIDKDIDDVSYLDEVIEKISDNFSIDKNKVFVSGVSNGAMMAYRMACEKADLINGVAAIAGTLAYPQCAPSEPVNIIHFHAKDDENVLYDGGCGPNCKSDYDHMSVADNMEFWRTANGCSEETKEIWSDRDSSCVEYQGCDTGGRTILCTTEKGGHKWLDGSDNLPASDLIWSLFMSKV